MDYFNSSQDITFFLTILLITLGALVLTRKLLKVEFPYFFMGVLGAVIGLVIGNLLGKSLDFLPGAYGRWLPIVVEVLVAVAIFDLFMAQAKAVSRFFSGILRNEGMSGPDIIVDTSVLIDGRIEDIASSGFLQGKLVVPKFVLMELQKIADSHDALKRVKGRKGLDTLANLQENRKVIVDIINDRLKDKDVVDNKIIRLAKDRSAKLLTVDYNLSRVAQIQSIEILNINALAVATKLQLVPGEEIEVKVVQKGKERHQGVGYLEDGTLVVVDNGDKHIGETKNCIVTRIYQTTTGKMIFVEPKR